ncbi:MAG: BirA family transcriptional regulator [Pyrinomonadaceae bacterium]|nr:BirA family transcriptional regulator [Pyrinomonadaceae bacterium]
MSFRLTRDEFEIDARRVCDRRVADLFQPTILRYDALPSTNTEAARQAARGAPEGLCVVAREQTRGRGRQERVWASPPDAGLYFSIVLRPRLKLEAWPLLTLAAALAVRDALAEACRLETDIKWPNDILAGGRKLCGILAETVETATGRACVLGIGINLSERAYPEELRERATSVEAATGAPVDLEDVLAALVRCLARRYAQLHAHAGEASIVLDWSANSTYAEGKRVRVHAATEVFDGTTRGLEPDGALRVQTAGDLKIVRAGDVHALRAETMNDEQ